MNQLKNHLQGRAPKTHQLTEAKQGKYQYTIGPYTTPVLSVRPVDRVVVQTREAFEGAVTSVAVSLCEIRV